MFLLPGTGSAGFRVVFAVPVDVVDMFVLSKILSACWVE
jgi:hypothetical protein